MNPPDDAWARRARSDGAVLPIDVERECVQRAAEGDSEAIGHLYDAYVEPLYRFCLSRVANETDAEDLTEEIFLKVMRGIDRFEWRPLPATRSPGANSTTGAPGDFEERSPFRAWLFRIARNHLVSHYRRESLRTSAGEVPEWVTDDRRGPQELAEMRLTIDEVFAAVEQLPPAQRDVIRLRFGAGLSVQETAEALEKQPTNVKVLQHKAVKRLKEILVGADAVSPEPE